MCGMLNLGIIENLYIVDFPSRGKSLLIVANCDDDIYHIIRDFRVKNDISVFERYDVSKADSDNRVYNDIHLFYNKILFKKNDA